MKCYIRIKKDNDSFNTVYSFDMETIPNIKDEFVHEGFKFKVMRRVFRFKPKNEAILYCVFRRIAQIEGFNVNEINVFDTEY